MSILWWNNKKNKKKHLTESEAHKKLDLIEKLLFPNFTTETLPNGSCFHVDYSTDSNLQAALVDLEDGINNQQTHETIGSVLKTLAAVRSIMQAYPIMDKNAEYIIVDTKPPTYIQEMETEI
jgi:hypothetical protein